MEIKLPMVLSQPQAKCGLTWYGGATLNLGTAIGSLKQASSVKTVNGSLRRGRDRRWLPNWYPLGDFG